MSKPLPKPFFDRLSALLSPDDLAGTIAAFGSERDAAFRVNTLKSSAEEVEAALTAKGIRFERVPELENAYVVPKSDEYALKGTDLFYGGKIYVQGFSSQLPVHFLDLKVGMRALDVCAAPGSKTTQMAAVMGNRGEIVALEKNQIRFDKLAYNCKLQGADIAMPEKTDALPYLAKNGALFDAILLDVPCSAEGRIRLDDERTFGFWSLPNIATKAELQTDLLVAALMRLAPGGTLVYSTCTLAPEENEGVVTAGLSAEAGVTLEECRIDLPEARPGLSEFEGRKFAAGISEKTLRILPSSRAEGFFVAKFRKAA
jgi:16S rRNA (cytosine1407-C5)-methyltransferase